MGESSISLAIPNKNSGFQTQEFQAQNYLGMDSSDVAFQTQKFTKFYLPPALASASNPNSKPCLR